MEPEQRADLDPDKDDLPLRANTNHMLVRHYVLDLSVDFQRKVIGGNIVLFLEPSGGASGSGSSAHVKDPEIDSGGDGEAASCVTNVTPEVSDGAGPNLDQADGSKQSWDDESSDFTLILDCCDLLVSRVEELDVSTVPELRKLVDEDQVLLDCDQHSSSVLVQRLMSVPSGRWRQQQDLYLQCSRACSADTQPLLFHMDQWSLQIRKKGVQSPPDFPPVLRIWYETKPTGGSVRWTKDQDERCCVYTMGSPINNRALFPCQEPPVAMSTWQACVRAPCEYTVLLSGENQARPTPQETGFLQWDYYVTMPMPASTFTIAAGKWQEARSRAHDQEESEESYTELNCSTSRNYPESQPSDQTSHPELACCTEKGDEQSSCSHVDYPCRFLQSTSRAELVIPHRLFVSSCLLQKAEHTVLPLLPLCLAAAHSVLGVHPFSRLDVLIVPPGFSSLGMASPHIIFLSQSVLAGERGLCGARLCHEIAHSWFGLVIGARDWTEEWISEGFATYLEDVFWAKVQQLAGSEDEEQRQMKALLRWRRLKDELSYSDEELQVLRPNKDSTGEVSESGASVVKHALNPGKPFMQVHYLKGYFLLKFLASKVGEDQFLSFFRLFVRRFHGQLILSQDFLQMFLDVFPALSSQGLTLRAIYADWLDAPGIPKWLGEISSTWSLAQTVEEVREEVVKWMSAAFGKGSKRKRAAEPKVNFKQLSPDQLVLLLEFLLEEPELSGSCLGLLQMTYSLREQDAEVKHRWCELVVKHRYTAAYRDVEHFLIHDQAMGVYLYGELMLQEDGRQQALARRCLSAIREDMDQSARSVVEEMIL